MFMLGANLFLLATLCGAPVGCAAQEPAKPAASAAAVIPDTPAGTGLKEFVASFNEGGDKRRAWLNERTTAGASATDILQQDAQFLQEHGTMTIVRVVSATPVQIVAILKHAKTGAHGHLTLDIDTAAPYKITNMQLRGATPEEIKGR